MDLFDIPMGTAGDVDELDVYLSQPVEKVRDVIQWWWDHCAVFPRLSVMALDFLSIPDKTCSVHLAMNLYGW